MGDNTVAVSVKAQMLMSCRIQVGYGSYSVVGVGRRLDFVVVYRLTVWPTNERSNAAAGA